MPRQPLRLPAPLASPASRRAPSLPLRGKSSAVGSGDSIRKRGTSSAEDKAPRGPTHRRRSSLSALIPELHPAPPLRQLILDHPLAVAFRLRDSWSVWRDGGIEQEYGRWRDEWERRRRDWRDAHSDSAVEDDTPRIAPPRRRREKADSKRHYRHILTTLALADKCVPNQTAFCVGCVISFSASGKESAALATGYSRELPGNTHAEESALAKLDSDTSLPAGAELDLYTSMEPCSVRSSGNVPCVQRILAFNARQGDKGARIVRVFMGVREPPDFVACAGVEELRREGVEVHSVVAPATDGLKDGWLEREALRIAKKSHDDQPQSEGAERMWRSLA
jgi:dolichyldiphosphatase